MNEHGWQVFASALVPHPSGEPQKQLSREIVGTGRICSILATEVVVQDSPIGGFVDMRQAEIHVVAFDGASHATDEDNGAIRLLPLDNSNVCQRVVHLTISVVVPCIVEEDEIAGIGNGPFVEPALLSYMRMNDPDTVGVRVAKFAAIEIDSMFEEHRAGHSGAVIGDVPAVTLDRCSAHELGGCLHNRVPAQREVDGSATGTRFRR
jgi:hypothetical protein